MDPAGDADRVLDVIEQFGRTTEAMLRAVEAGNWDEVERLDDCRREHLSATVFEGLEGDGLAAVVERLRDLVAQDARLQSAARHSRTRMLEAVRTLRGQRRARAAYQALARQGVTGN